MTPHPPTAGPLSPADEPDALDFGRILRAFRRHWILLIGLQVTFMGLIGTYWAMQRPVFEAEALVYLDSKNTSNSLSSSMSSLLPGLGADPDIAAQQGILESNGIAIQAIGENGLNTSLVMDNPVLFPKQRYWQWVLHHDPAQCGAGLRVARSNTAPDRFLPVNFVLVFDGKEGFTVHEMAEKTQPGKKLADGVFGQPVQMAAAHFTLFKDAEASPAPAETATLKIVSAAAAVDEFGKSLTISVGGSKTKTSNLLTVSYKHASPFVARRVVESVIANYTAQSLHEAVASSQLTLDFVTSQLNRAREDMQKSTEALARYQQSSGLIDLSPQMQAELQALLATETTLRDARQDQTNAREKASRLAALAAKGAAALTRTDLAELNDPSVRQLADQLMQNEVELTLLASRFKPGHEALAAKTKEREILLATLNKTGAVQLESNLRMAQNSLRDAESRVATLAQEARAAHDRMAALPQSNRQLADLLRAVKTDELMYETLLQDQSKAQAAVASTLTNIHLKDPPIVPLQPLSPKSKTVLASTLAGSLMLAALIILIIGMRVRWFEGVEEAETACARPVFAILPNTGIKARRAETGNLIADRHGVYPEAMRHLRSNLLQTTGGKHQVVMITSSMPGDGKTLTSTNLAAQMARSDRLNSVLLVDADMHAPSMHGVFGLPQSPGLSDYLNGSAQWEDIVHAVDLGHGHTLKVVTAGPTPAAASDLIDSEAMRALVARLREEHDFTLLDLPPFPLVSVASILAPQVDRILSVCRIGKTWRALYLRHLETLTALNPRLGLVFNVPDRGIGGGYGYGYGYGYGGYGNKGYGHQNLPQDADKEADTQTPSSKKS